MFKYLKIYTLKFWVIGDDNFNIEEDLFEKYVGTVY